MDRTKAVANYRRGISHFPDEIQDWLVDIYLDHGNHVDRRLVNYLKSCPEILLATSDDDYKCIANEIFPCLINELSYLSGDEDNLFELLKLVRNKATPCYDDMMPNIGEKFNKWIDETNNTYGIDLIAFANHYHSW